MLSTDKSSAVVALSLRESLTRSRTRLRRLHSDVNRSDGLAKFDHRAVTLIRHFLQRPVLKIVFDKCAFFWSRSWEPGPGPLVPFQRAVDARTMLAWIARSVVG